MTRTQVGHVFQEKDGDEITVYIYQYGNEEPDEVEVNSRACLLSFELDTLRGRTQIRTLMDRLEEAMSLHRRQCNTLYGRLEPGDYCVEIRLPLKDEGRCSHATGPGTQCSRAVHEDYHHITVDAEFTVTAVDHITVGAF